MEYTNKTEFRIIHWKGNLEDGRMVLTVHREDVITEPFNFHRYF